MMYQIEYMGQMVYAPDIKHCVLEPKLDVELNSAGTLTFTVPVENEYLWNNIEVFKGEVRVYEDDDIIWFGRPLQIVRNWKNQKVVTCEGALAYFNDSLQATHTYEKIPLYTSPDYQPGKEGFFNTIIGLHNDQVRISEQDHSHEFVVGNVDVQNEVNIYRQVDYQTTAEVLQQMCLDTTGGYFILRKEKEGENFVTYIDWYKQVPYGADQDIQFGLNLLDLNQDLNGSDICTVVLAFGKDDKTVAGLNKYDEQHPYVMSSGSLIYHNGEYIFHKTAYEKYGRVVKVKNWSDMSAVGADNKEQLFIKAAEWLEDQNTDTTTIECSAADLHYLKQYAEKGKLRIGQLVHVTSSIHGLEDKVLPIYKISMSLDSGAKTITMGTPPKRELTDIVKPSGGSTRGSSGATGGGGSGSGSGGGGSSNVPVKDVMVKYPGDEDFHTAVNKKVAKIDLTDISGGVKDVRIDGASIVDPNTHIANLDSSEFGTDVEANPEGAPSGDLSSIGIDGVKYNIPTVTNVVEDVTLDSESIVDPNDNVAKILSRDIIEGGIEGNFEHVVTKDNNFPSGHPSKDFGKKTDILIETDIDDDEVSILSEANTPINLEEMGGWISYVQDFVAQPTGYYDEGGQWKYDPTTPTRFYSKITCNGAHSASWWFANVEGEIRPFTGHTGTIQTRGYKINNSGYPDITFEKHDPNIKYKPTRVVGTFNFECMHAGDSTHGPEESDRCNSSIIRIHVSNDGENWTVFEPTSTPSDGNGTFEFGIDEYYSYVRMICKSFLYQGSGYLSFNVYAVPESHIENIWFKTENKAWIKQHIPKIKPNSQGASVGDLTSITIDGDKYDIPENSGTEVEPNPQGTSVGTLTSIGIDGDKYDIPSGTEVIPNPVGTPTDDLETVQIGSDIYSIPTGGAAGHLDGIVSPDPSIGSNGDEYFKLSGAMPNLKIVSLKFEVTARKGGGNGMVQYSQLGFYDENDNKFSWPAETTWSDDVGHYENDPIAVNNKLLLVSIPGTVTINLPSGSYIDSNIYTKFGWFTANDSSDRDPISWKLYASENGTDYILVDARSQQTIPDQRLVLAFKDAYLSSGNPVIETIYYKKSGIWLKDDYVSISKLYDACIANGVIPISKSINDIVAVFLTGGGGGVNVASRATSLAVPSYKANVQVSATAQIITNAQKEVT